MNNKNIKDVFFIYDVIDGKQKFLKAWMTIDGKKIKVEDHKEINRYLNQLKEQEHVSKIKELPTDICDYRNSKKILESYSSIEEFEEVKDEEYFKNNFKLKKAGVIAGTLVAAGLIGAAALTSCGKEEKVATAEETTDLDIQLTDNDILQKDFNYYAENYDYSIQMKVAYTAEAFLTEANTKVKNMGLKLPDGSTVNGLFTAEEAWVYAITVHNLGTSEIVDIYQDSTFDYSKFEDVKQNLISKLIEYQMLVGLGKLEQIDFAKESILPNDEMIKTVFTEIASQTRKLGKNIDSKDETKTNLKDLKELLENYFNEGKLSQQAQDIMQIIISPAYYTGETVQLAYGMNNIFNTEFKKDLVGIGVCYDIEQDKKTEETTTYKEQSQHDTAWSDTASVMLEAEKINNESIKEDKDNNTLYQYFINDALQQLANNAPKAEKDKYLTLTIENAKEVHVKAESLVRQFLIEDRNMTEGTDKFNQAFNDIVTDKQDSRLTPEAILALLKNAANAKGIDIESNLNYSIEELNFYLTEVIAETIKDASLSFGVSGSTKLPAPVKRIEELTREQAVAAVGEKAVEAAEKAAFDNDASKDKAEENVDEVQKEAQENLDNGNHDEFKENAGKHETDHERKEEMKDNAEQAVEDKKELEDLENKGGSGAENINPEIKDYIEEGKDPVIVDQGTIPEGAYTGNIEFSNGETLGKNADNPQITNNVTNSNTPSNNGFFSGGDVVYDIPEDYIDMASTFSLIEEYSTSGATQEEIADAVIQEMENNPTATEEESKAYTK